MKKWMFLIAVAAVAVIAVGVYYLVTPESNDYSGSTYSSDCTMNIDNDSYELTYTGYSNNSYYSERSIYSGKIDAGTFIVNSCTIQYCEFGKVYKETAETGMSVPLTDMIFFREVTGGYLVKETFVQRTNSTSSSSLLYVTTQEALDGAGCDITLLKSSPKSDIAKMTIVEIFSDGTTCDYSVDPKLIGDTDLNTVGVKRISVGYGDGKVANLTLDVVPFIVEKNEIMNRGTSFDYAQSTGKMVLNKAEGIGDVCADGWDSTDGTKRISLRCGDYSKSILVTFTSDSDRTVLSGSINADHYIKKGTDLPAYSIHMVLNNGTVYDVQSNDPQVTVSGYDKNVLGAQSVKMTYLGSSFSVALYTYDDSNLIPKDAYLININKTYDSRDSLLMYTAKGVNYDNYAIKYIMCDGTEKRLKLTEDIVYYDGLDIEKRTTSSATIATMIDVYCYNEKVTVKYDSTEEDIIGSLTISKIIGDHTSSNFSMATDSGTYNISFGYRAKEFYIAHDLVSSSSYLSDNVSYTYSGSDSFTIIMNKAHAIDMNRSIIAGSELIGYTIDPGDILNARYSATMTAEDIAFFKGLGLSVGDKVTFSVTYNASTGTTTALDISKGEVKLASGTFDYGGAVILSDKVQKYVSNYDTVTIIMKFSDGRNDSYYNVNRNVKDLTFDCEEGYGIFQKVGDRYVPFIVPEAGISTTVEVYYMKA